MKLSINQPAFLPWLGYFHRVAISDLHIVLDHVQFEKNSVTNRNKIRTHDDTAWLTVPVNTSGRFGNNPINKIEITNTGNWQRKITETIKQFYKKAPFFKSYFPFLEETILNRRWLFLNDLIKDTNDYFFKELQINTPVKYSSEMKVEGVKSDLVLNLCKEVNCETYISGPFGRTYLDTQKFIDSRINVIYHDYRHPNYSQVQSGFIPNLSIIDLLFNHGKEAKNILMVKSMAAC